MADKKLARGRPKGSGKKDGETLASVADALVRNPKLSDRAAMLRVIRSRGDWCATQEETLLRRLQGKWAKDKAMLLEAARERVERVDVPSRPVGNFGSLPSMSRIEALQKWVDSPVVKAAQGYIQSPAYQRFLGYLNSPQMTAFEKYARGMIEDPFQKRLLEMQKAAGTAGLNKWGQGFF